MKSKILFKGPLLTRSGYGEQTRFALRALRTYENFFDIYAFLCLHGRQGYGIIRKMKTKGATSHIDVPLSSIVAVLQPTAMVRVSRRWANAMGGDGARPAPPEAPACDCECVRFPATASK